LANLRRNDDRHRQAKGDAQADDPGAGIRGKPVELYPRKAMFGSTHSYRGQQALAVEVCSALQSTDLGEGSCDRL
jgi:hypothetical protein